MQEAYRPPRSKYSLCCCLLGRGVPPSCLIGGVPHTDLAGVIPSPHQLDGGTPPPGCKQTENITFPHPSDAGSNKTKNWTELQSTALPPSLIGQANSK